MFVKRDDKAQFSDETVEEAAENAILEPGAQVVLVGDSGVGKTSLMLNLLRKHHKKYAQVQCTSEQSLEEMLENTLVELGSAPFRPSKTIQTEATSKSGQFTPPSFNVGAENRTERVVESENIALLLWKRVAKTLHANGIEILFFDNLQEMEREDRSRLGGMMEYFADIPDAQPELSPAPKIVCAGIARNLHDLIGKNLSRKRRVIEVSVPHMPAHKIEEIAETGFNSLGLNMERPAAKSVGFHSDGFPYYAHLICKNAGLNWIKNQADSIKLFHIESALGPSSTQFDSTFNELLTAARGKKSAVRLRSKVLDTVALSDTLEWEASTVMQSFQERFPDLTSRQSDISNALNKLEEMGILNKRAGSHNINAYSFVDPQFRVFVRMHPED